MTHPSLQTKQLSIHINKKFICKDLHLDLFPGQLWGVLGANGSGKTTLLHTLAGLAAPTSGDIFLHHANLKQLPAKTIAKSLGILFQDIHTALPLTVWDYCIAGRYPHLSFLKKTSTPDEQIVMQALQQVELDQYQHAAITTLSGGEKRRLAIAALLAQTPDIYLLDEPTNHLDLRHQISILDYFRHLADIRAATIMMTLHDPNLAQNYCDHIVLLFPDGRTKLGPAKEILTPENLSSLYQLSVKSLTHDKQLYWMPY